MPFSDPLDPTQQDVEPHHVRHGRSLSDLAASRPLALLHALPCFKWRDCSSTSQRKAVPVPEGRTLRTRRNRTGTTAFEIRLSDCTQGPSSRCRSLSLTPGSSPPERPYSAKLRHAGVNRTRTNHQTTTLEPPASHRRNLSRAVSANVDTAVKSLVVANRSLGSAGRAGARRAAVAAVQKHCEQSTSGPNPPPRNDNAGMAGQWAKLQFLDSAWRAGRSAAAGGEGPSAMGRARAGLSECVSRSCASTDRSQSRRRRRA